MNKWKSYELYFQFSKPTIFQMNLSKGMGKSSKFAHMVKKFIISNMKTFNESLRKSTNIVNLLEIYNLAKHIKNLRLIFQKKLKR